MALSNMVNSALNKKNFVKFRPLRTKL